jgi:hypothetical protein
VKIFTLVLNPDTAAEDLGELGVAVLSDGSIDGLNVAMPVSRAISSYPVDSNEITIAEPVVGMDTLPPAAPVDTLSDTSYGVASTAARSSLSLLVAGGTVYGIDSAVNML